jgi:predicted secreted acid phosphatase
MADEDFGYIPRDWDAWVDLAKAPAIAGVLRLEQSAEQLGVAVFFITGRDDTQRAATEKNLRAAGYSGWAGLTLRSKDELHEATIPYKSAARAAIVKAGYRIVLNVGDQCSDLKGSPQAEFNVKLPNPFYYIP